MTEAGGIVGEFLSLKAETDADLLAMQCGDFYEFFDEDAERVAEELDLQISQKSSHGSSYPMAGVPVDDLTPYLTALVERGYRVAVADQYETDGGHAREIVRVVSPGTLLESREADARYLAAVLPGDDGGYGLAFADVTTGRFLVASAADREAALTELYRFDPVEVLPGPNTDETEEIVAKLDATVTTVEDSWFGPSRSRHAVDEQFGSGTADRLEESSAAVGAAGAILAYLEESSPAVLAALSRIRSHRGEDHVTLDATTQRNLELTETMQGANDATLFGTIDHTVTSAGRRRLKGWLQRPRRSTAILEERQDCIEALAAAALAREEVRDTLATSDDLERLASRASQERADARDLLAVRDSLAALPELIDIVRRDDTLDRSPLRAILDRPDAARAAELQERIDGALVDEPPATITEGGLFRQSYDPELGDIIDRHESALEWLDTLADREAAAQDLSHVSVDRNTTDGYYIQVGKSAADDVPEHYEEIKTLKNSKRFTTPELEEREREVLQLEERRSELEYELFVELRAEVAAATEPLQDVGRALATVDALASLATHAASAGWVRPTLRAEGDIDIVEGRHPVVEQTTEFVPNDCELSAEQRFLVVTGPNMSGKSTYLRQTACIVLLAQIGSFVPATEATIGLVDGIFTRVGALDELARGRSTFMVEMSELANILHAATADSLVILDEVGRGTATYDGISIAWAATEYLHNEVKARTLFATHYHELTGLAEHLPRVANVHVAADERDGEVTFLRTIQPGPTDRSYGIHVADLAGVPEPVVDRSRKVLERLRAEKAIEARGGTSDGPVQAVFDLEAGSVRRTPASPDGGASAEEIDPSAQAIIDELASMDLETSTPIDVLSQVEAWQRRLTDE